MTEPKISQKRLRQLSKLKIEKDEKTKTGGGENMTSKIYSNDQLPCMLNANDIKEYMRISRTQAYEQMHAEGFPLIRIGKRMLAPRDKFLQWVDEQTAR